MATKIETDYPSSPANDESDPCDQDDVDNEEDVEPEPTPVDSNVAQLLARLQSSGALIKKPKQEYRCFTCDLDFSDSEDRDNHIIQHVALPYVILHKLSSEDEEDEIPSCDENWSDEEEMPPQKQIQAKTPQKIDISQFLKNTGVSLKKSGEKDACSSNSALDKLSGLGFTIKKNSPSVKTEKPDTEPGKSNDLMQKLGKLGGIKLKLKSDGNNSNTFKVVNGLRDFKASDDEDEPSEYDTSKDDQDDDENDRSGPQEHSGAEQDSGDEQYNPNSRKTSESDDSEKGKRIMPNFPKGIQGKLVTPKPEPIKTPVKVNTVSSQQEEIQPKLHYGPAMKQTPKRTNIPIASKEMPKNDDKNETLATVRTSISSTPERRHSNDNMNNVVVKQEPQVPSQSGQSNLPLFSGQIKSERTSPSLPDSSSTPILATVKSDPDAPLPAIAQPSFVTQNIPKSQPIASAPLMSVPKIEESMTIIEINGDSNDEDDDCCVVSATPAPDVKPIVPKVENLPPPPPYTTTTTPTTTYTSSQSNYNSTPTLQSRLTTSTEKQHNFNWNAPDSKPAIDMLEKSADEIFESLLMSSTKKESMSISDASEYISLDTLGPQHSCEVCNTRFTDISLLEDHKRMTGHSSSLVTPSSSTLLPYNPSSNILSSLLPVKQLAEQVGKLSTMGNSGPGFTHQQNVMINIQAYPGSSGVMVPPQSYNSYAPGQNMHAGYPQTNMYGAQSQPMQGQGMPGQQMPGQQMPGQYQNNYNMGQGYGQFQTPMSKSSYPGAMPPNSYANSSSPYSSASPLQSMQQSVYGQSSMMNQQPISMGPPGMSPSHSTYVPTSSPNLMKPPANPGIRIQNVQTFPLVGPVQPNAGQPNLSQDMNSNQISGQTIGGQIPGPTPIRMATGAHMTGPRPRMPGVRGPRPTIRSGIQVHGQIRGGKAGPRLPMKRQAGPGGPGGKRRTDMLLPGKHDNEDCQVMAMQKQRDGLPMIQSVQGAKDKLNLGSQISITKKTVNKEANAMANVLASRGISIKQKQKSRSPTPERPLPHIPNLGAGVSIKHTSKSTNFSIPEAKVGGGMLACKICKKMFMNHNSLQVHMTNAHPQSKVPVFKCDECPASYPKSLQLQHHKRVFHNVSGPNRELGLPVVDLSQEDTLQRLSNLGIYSFIPLANREITSGCFGIPVISVHNMQNGITSNLEALGADGLLSLGPLKTLRNS